MGAFGNGVPVPMGGPSVPAFFDDELSWRSDRWGVFGEGLEGDIRLTFRTLMTQEPGSFACYAVRATCGGGGQSSGSRASSSTAP